MTKSTFGLPGSRCFSLVVAGALAWLVSLGLPAIALPGGETYRGVRILLDGWRAVALGIPAWCANPALVVALAGVALKRYGVAALLSGLSLALAASSLGARWFAALGGTMLPDFVFEVGFFLWISSTLVVFAGACCGALQQHGKLM